MRAAGEGQRQQRQRRQERKEGRKEGQERKEGRKRQRRTAGRKKDRRKLWNCDKPGHTSQDCRQPRREGLKSLGDEDDDDDDDSDTDSDDESTGVAGLSIGCLDECTVFSNFVDISWRVPDFDDLYNVSQEAASHLSDEAGESRNTCSAPLLAFSTVDPGVQ